MDAFSNHVLETIDRYKMIPRGAGVVAAVSGGADSLCMLHVLLALRPVRKFTVCAAHVNHGLREEADEDEEFVRRCCEDAGVPFYACRRDVAAYASQRGLSLEAAGREVRYSFLEEAAAQAFPEGTAVIATAHHANDNAESVIMRLLRGAGLGGFCGIAPVRGRIIRPLIRQTRSQVEEYCRRHALAPRTDKTNFDDRITRNDIRLNVMPPIEARGGVEAIGRVSEVLRAEEDLLQFLASQAAGCAKEKDGEIRIRARELNRLHLALRRRVLRQALEACAPELGLEHIDSVLAISEKGVGNKYTLLPGGVRARLQKGTIIIRKRCQEK